MRFFWVVPLLVGCESVGCWDADGNVTPGECACADGDDLSGEALVAVNAARSDAGLPAVVRLSELDDAAAGHVAYLEENDPYLLGRSAHVQVPGESGFTGADHFARAVASGWSGPRLYENVSLSGAPERAVFSWLRTVYHRMPLLVPEVTGMGFASVCTEQQRFDVALFAESDRVPSAEPVVWPAPGDDFVPGVWSGLESPDPLPDIDAEVGYPITVQLGRGIGRTTGLRLLDADGAEVPTRFLDAASDPAGALDDEVAAVPLEPLEPETTYTVQAQGSGASGEWQREWSFTTRTAAQTPQ